MEKMEVGDSCVIKKLNEAEFILHAKQEINQLFAEAVTAKSHEKFADILEIINCVCETLGMDWYECSKIKSAKRWDSGVYKGYLAKKISIFDQEE
tara:strand:+ start:1225 stop:1509 length:285 start_codon:yes stop_codon:yes gene_type:complete